MDKVQKPDQLFVVGVASSAGGIAPLMDLIENAICHENMAFVLVPHLSRDFETQLPNILKSVSSLQICVIKADLKLKPCHLYILPPGFYARIVGAKFLLDPRPESGVNYSADVLFKSLAECYGRNSVGVVLSGADVGSDGSRGVIAIKEAGGHTYAQNPETAEFPGMPRAAISTGAIDQILEPGQIGHDLSLVSWAAD